MEVEVVLYCVLTSVWWAASATFLLPILILLKYSTTFTEWWFYYFFRRLLKIILMPKFIPLRKKAFKLLSEQLSGRDSTKPLKVLEIGIGAGANLQFYPENSHLTALDMDVNSCSLFKERKKMYPQIVCERTIVSAAENMKDVDDCSMDLVISTYLLCSVTNLSDVLKEVKRVLKPGGKFLYLEHVLYPKFEWGFIIQRFASPLWTLFLNGCCLLKDIGNAINNSGFSDVVCEKVYPQTLPLYIRPHIYGVATK